MPEASQPPARNAFKTCPYPLEEPVGTEELDVDVHRLFESTLPSQLARTGQPVLSDGVSVGFDVNGIGRWQVVGGAPTTRVAAWSSGRCDCEVRCGPDDLERLLAGGFRAARAYATGRVLVEGDIGLLLILRDAVVLPSRGAP